MVARTELPETLHDRVVDLFPSDDRLSLVGDSQEDGADCDSQQCNQDDWS